MDRREVFVQVVASGSFTAAAGKLGVSTSYASRCVRELEERLGVPLLARTTRALHLTEVGRRYHARLAPLFAGLEEADREVAERVIEPRGTLRVALPQAFGRWVLPSLLRYRQRWPAVQVDVQFSDRITDPLAVDLTVRGGLLRDSALVARRLVDYRIVLAASPSFVAARGPFQDPSDLDGLPAAWYTGGRDPDPWRLTSGEDAYTPRVEPVFRADSGDALVVAAAAGQGVILQPDFLVGPAVARGELMPVLPEWSGRGGHFWALTPSRLMPATVRTFVEQLVEDLAEKPWLEGCEGEAQRRDQQ